MIYVGLSPLPSNTNGPTSKNRVNDTALTSLPCARSPLRSPTAAPSRLPQRPCACSNERIRALQAAGAMILRDVAAISTISASQRRVCAGAPGMSIRARLALCKRSATFPTLPSNKLSYGSDPLRSATPISRMTRPPFSGVVCVRTSLCSDAVMTRPPFPGPTLRTTIAPSKSSVTIISPLRAAVRYRLDPKRIISAPMRIAPGPAATGIVESLGDLVAWRWRSGVQPRMTRGRCGSLLLQGTCTPYSLPVSRRLADIFRSSAAVSTGRRNTLS